MKIICGQLVINNAGLECDIKTSDARHHFRN